MKPLARALIRAARLGLVVGATRKMRSSPCAVSAACAGPASSGGRLTKMAPSTPAAAACSANAS